MNQVQIETTQLDRIFNPLISEGNNNLVYSLAANNKDKLADVFKKLL